jgi:transcription elongation factor GreA
MSALSTPAVDEDVLVTARGYSDLCVELEALRTVRRAALIAQLREAREDRDPENPMLFELLEEQAQLEGRITVLEAQLAAARVVEPVDGIAAIGSRVRVRHRGAGEVVDYELVGPIESHVGSGRVSVGAPVGKALIGAVCGDSVVVETPRGRQELEIVAVSPACGRTGRRAA